MLCVAEGHIHQLDAFNGTLLQTYNTGIPSGSLGLGAIFSPDSNYVLSGVSLLLLKIVRTYSRKGVVQANACTVLDVIA